QPGEKRQDFIFDSTPTLAIRRLATIFDSLLTPLNGRWHGLRSPIKELNDDPEVRKFYDDVTDILFQSRYRPRAGFAAQNFERWLGLSAFGTATLFIGDALGDGPNYRNVFLGELFFLQNIVGELDTVYRLYPLTAKMAAEEFGEDKLPEKVTAALENGKDAGKEFKFIHCVVPNPDHDPNRLHRDFMKFRSWTVSVEDKSVIREAGYNTFPYSTSRFFTSPGETYGRSPAIEMLPQIKVLHQERKTQIEAGHRAIAPPLLLRDDGVMNTVDIRAGGTIIGGIDENGNRTVLPLDMGSNLNLSFEMQLADRKMVNSAFFIDLFEILLDTPQMTATEFLGRAQEKGILLNPIIGRQMSEALGPLVEREIDILAQAGKLPELPPELVEADGDNNYEVEYTGPMARAQKAEGAVGAARTVQTGLDIAAFDPSVLDNYDFDRYIRITKEANGAEESLLRDPDEVKAIRAQREQIETAQALAQAAPGVAKAGLDDARTQKTLTEV
ncbi:MAG: hypothetical protein IIB38_03790, partial [Candidatus Hydrogenedentes bacterium]|nr:hypothetical protein [Candidatus Hydrogenedentota bacterium]